MDSIDKKARGYRAQPPLFAHKMICITPASLDGLNKHQKMGRGVGIMKNNEMIQNDDNGRHGWPQKRRGVGRAQHPPFANNMICITLPY